MEVFFAFTALVVFAIVALRFGRDSREGFRSSEHELAGYGVTWDDLGPSDFVPVVRPPYPTLAFIERALGGSPGPLTFAANAAALEVRARELVAEYWSDTVWTTGIVPQRALERVVAELAPFFATAPASVEDSRTLAERDDAAVPLAA